MTNEVKKNSEQVLKDLKSNISDWKEQLSKGWDESVEMYNEQRHIIGDWTDEAIAQLNRASNRSSEQWSKLKDQLDQLKNMVSQKGEQSKEAMEEQRNKLLQSLKSVQDSVRSWTDRAEADAVDFWSSANTSLEESLRRIELFRVQFNLARIKSEAEFDKRKEQIAEQVSELEESIRQKAANSTDKMSEISAEVGKAWNNIADIVSR